MLQTLTSYKVSLTTLSPLFIGAGEEQVLSPYSDFVQRGDSLLYIDTGRLREAMQDDQALVEAYVKGVRQFENNRSIFSLEDFITGTLGREVDDFETRIVKIEGSVEKKHIRRFIATGGKPFIPGSSLKGAIRTAILVDWLLNRTEGKQQLDRVREHVENGHWDSLKSMNPEQACFGNIANDALRHLRVSDSEIIDRSNLSVGEMKRVPLPLGGNKQKQKSSNIPQWSEIVGPSAETKFSLSMTTTPDETGFTFLDNQSIDSLFSIINQVSLDSCLRELDELEALNEFRDFFRFYETLEQEIKSLKANEAILRLGGGKTWFDNSIGLSIDSDVFGEEKFLGQYLDLLRIGKIPFPSTRSAIIKDNVPFYPLGWIKLSVEA
ncbi:MAG: type III-A CRISPR-associated RAMP protein Csm5 [Chlorobiales bacterium]|nr:type III-A CRISPR-associated RAMP protein Csm5 [Chlorobiales bacterium]